MRFYIGSQLWCQEDIVLIRRMTDIDQHTALFVWLIHCVVHVTSAIFWVTVIFVRVADAIVAGVTRLFVLIVVFVVRTYINHVCTKQSNLYGVL